MPDTIDGLPLHPLVVHAVVVLLPLAALGVLVLAAWRPWRRPYGPLVVAVSVLAAAAIPVATSSGENLERLVGDPGRHAQLGDTLIWFAIPLVIASVALVWLDRRQGPAPVAAQAKAEAVPVGGRDMSSRTLPRTPVASHAVKPKPARQPGLVLAVSVLAALIAIANLVQVIRVGDTGARAAWGNAVSNGRRGG